MQAISNLDTGAVAWRAILTANVALKVNLAVPLNDRCSTAYHKGAVVF